MLEIDFSHSHTVAFLFKNVGCDIQNTDAKMSLAQGGKILRSCRTVVHYFLHSRYQYYHDSITIKISLDPVSISKATQVFDERRKLVMPATGIIGY